MAGKCHGTVVVQCGMSTNLGDPLGILLAHDRWATHRLLEVMGTLRGEQLHQVFAIGIGTLHGTIVHNAGAIRVWTDTLTRRDPARVWMGDEAGIKDLSVEGLRAKFDGVHAELVEASRAGAMDERFERERRGVKVTLTRAAILMHVCTHGVHHRAQAMNMLRQLGVTGLPQSSVTEWCVAEGGTKG
jgi:uncharacterized damage-inducible protein DinB